MQGFSAAYIYFWLVCFGACVGSFLNVVIYRLPKGIFFSSARSVCPACGARLGLSDLVPVISWLCLGGKCRRCSARISVRYPIIELAGAVLAAGSFARFGFSPMTPLFFGVSAILLAVSAIDLGTMEIPDPLVIALIPFAAAAALVPNGCTLLDRCIGFAAVSAPMLLMAAVIDGAFGGGDIKLMAVCGFMLGWRLALLAFFLALVTGGGYASYLLISGKSKKGAHIAFGPYLCFGVAVALLWGEEILNWYFNLFYFYG